MLTSSFVHWADNDFLNSTYILTVQCFHGSSFKSTTLSPNERIKILKHMINQEIKIKPIPAGETFDEFDDDELVNNLPIVPIVKTAPTFPPEVTEKVSFPANKTGKVSSNRQKKKKTRLRKPALIFYRRAIEEYLLNEPFKLAHCLDMITPYLSGVKNYTKSKLLMPKDPAVKRFIQLLSVDTSQYSRDEIYSMLYQISQVKLRLFHWEVSSVKKLVGTIIKGRKPSFRSLKAGIKEMFASWKLDITNVTTLLTQTRIFRPPCVKISSHDGSTKGGKISRYTKTTESTTPCDD